MDKSKVECLSPAFKWRIPACLIGFCTLIIYSTISVWIIITFIQNGHIKDAPSTSELLAQSKVLDIQADSRAPSSLTTPPSLRTGEIKRNEEDKRPDRTWLWLLAVDAALFLPVTLLQLFWSTRLILATATQVKGKPEWNYDMSDNADDKLQGILGWRLLNLRLLVVYGVILVVDFLYELLLATKSRWLPVLFWLGLVAVQYASLWIVRQHISELCQFVNREEKEVKNGQGQIKQHIAFFH